MHLGSLRGSERVLRNCFLWVPGTTHHHSHEYRQNPSRVRRRHDVTVPVEHEGDRWNFYLIF